MISLTDFPFSLSVLCICMLFIACILQSLRLVFVLFIDGSQSAVKKAFEVCVLLWFFLCFRRFAVSMYRLDEKLSPGAGMLVFVFVLTLSISLFLFFRCVYLFAGDVLGARLKVNLLSVKEALDTMPDGIAFSKPDGTPLLVNSAMDRLSGIVSSGAVHNVNALYETFIKANGEEGFKSIPVSDSCPSLDLGEHGAWHIRREILNCKGKAYICLCAVDITEEYILASRVDEANERLEATASRMQAMIDNAYRLEEERMRLILKNKAHDVLGQRLSLLHRYLENYKDTNISLEHIKQLLTGIEEDIFNETSDIASSFESIKEAYANIGTTVTLTGAFPENEAAVRVMFGVIREALTNAVRHADAKNIFINIASGKLNHVMIITNDGTPALGTIKEGGGISGMRHRLQQAGGNLSVNSDGVFTLTATLPKDV